jgi:SAM-dependent methyltransferase
MSETAKHDAWSAGQNYEHYMGRWSRQIAGRFIDWLQPPRNVDWLDIGCGTGALSQTILDRAKPKSLTGIDPSDGFVDHSSRTIGDERAGFKIGGAEEIPLDANSVDVVASALVLNFVPDKPKAFAEMRRVVRPGGLISFYVWDYPGGGMGFIDAFWNAAAEVDSNASELDEGQRFPFCTLEGLRQLCHVAGFEHAQIVPLEVETIFPTFEDFWQPFTLGAGPAPGYNLSISEEARSDLKAELRSRLDTGGEVVLPARAWAVKMTCD